jgi:DNA-binding protein YbaB
VNQALAKAKELHAEAMQAVTGEMNLPGLDEALEKITGREQ